MSQQQPDFQDRWIQHQRRNHKTTQFWACSLCPDRKISQTAEDLWQHARSQHEEKLPNQAEKLQRFRSKYEAESFQQNRPSKDANKLSAEYPPRLSKPRKQLWNPDDTLPTTRAELNVSNIASIQTYKPKAGTNSLKARKPLSSSRTTKERQPNPILPAANFKSPSPQQMITDFDIILQPETRPISQEQLVAEVKGIYAGLVMVEAKCIEVDNKLTSSSSVDPHSFDKLNNEQWQALIALHRTLLHEHHDFFLASQHPSASPALRRLASKYAMPARVWRHGIHSFLELLRHRLPASLDHMLAFIYLAYDMMALLYETVPAFEDTWIECLGDLGRYRMAIEDDDMRDREVWKSVARHWYSKASDKAPTTGRLYHHLAILARPNALQQLFYYAKSLCIAVPFSSAKESILTLFEPVLGIDSRPLRFPLIDTAFLKCHGFWFKKLNSERYHRIGRVTSKFMKQGHPIAFALRGALYTDNYLPDGWFMEEKIDDEEKYYELASLTAQRNERQQSYVLRHSARTEDALPYPCREEPATVDREDHKCQRLAAQFRPLSPNNRHGRHIMNFLYLSLCAIFYRILEQIRGARVTSSRSHHQLRRRTSRKSYLMVAVLMHFLPLTDALPIPSSGEKVAKTGLPFFFQESWRTFCNEIAGPLLENLLLGLILLLIFYRIISPRLDYRVLPYTLRFVAGGIFYLGMEERISNYILAEFWLFSASLIVVDLNRRLAPSPASRQLKTFAIGTLGITLAIIPTCLLSPPAGRYSNPWAVGIVAFLPMTAFIMWFWDVAIMAIRACTLWILDIIDELALVRSHSN